MNTILCFIILSVNQPNDMIQNVNFISSVQVHGAGTRICEAGSGSGVCYIAKDTLKDVTDKIQQCFGKQKQVSDNDLKT